jgi:hypothetical protein
MVSTSISMSTGSPTVPEGQPESQQGQAHAFVPGMAADLYLELATKNAKNATRPTM